MRSLSRRRFGISAVSRKSTCAALDGGRRPGPSSTSASGPATLLPIISASPCGGAVADLEQQGVAAASVDDLMAVRPAGRESRRHAGGQQLLAAVRDEHDLALDDVDELVLPAVPVPLRGGEAGRQPHEIDAGSSAGGCSGLPSAMVQPLWKGCVGTPRRRRVSVRPGDGNRPRRRPRGAIRAPPR